MAEPFLGEIRVTSFAFPPKGWALCNGQLLPINQNQALFAILGTQYGGNGQTNFALPNLQGRVPMHQGNSHVIGEAGGESAHTLTVAEMARHQHDMNASNSTANASMPAGASVAKAAAGSPPIYAGTGSMVAMHPQAVANAGGNQPHNNVQPSLGLNFIIALQGIFPSQN